MKTTQKILNDVSISYRQKDFDYALTNCLRSYLHLIVEESMEIYSKKKFSRELKKVITEMQNEKGRIIIEKKKHRKENSRLAFLCGEEKQIDYFMDWLQRLLIVKHENEG